jgi:hypothetical protein
MMLTFTPYREMNFEALTKGARPSSITWLMLPTRSGVAICDTGAYNGAAATETFCVYIRPSDNNGPFSSPRGGSSRGLSQVRMENLQPERALRRLNAITTRLAALNWERALSASNGNESGSTLTRLRS